MFIQTMSDNLNKYFIFYAWENPKNPSCKLKTEIV